MTATSFHRPFSTAKRRNEIYRKMLKMLIENPMYSRNVPNPYYPGGLCRLLQYQIHSSEIWRFPELMKSMPPVDERVCDNSTLWGSYWWRKDKEGTENRIEVLLVAIAATSKV